MSIFSEDNDATALSEDDKQDLKLSWVSSRDDLNEAEFENIVLARDWLFRQRNRHKLNERFVRMLHRRMFDDVWHWAGQYRRSNTNLGIDWHQISVELKKLLDNTQYWIDHQTYLPDEMAVRFHHQLVWIHPFPNGNGRLARLITDWLLFKLDASPFQWGDKNLLDEGENRQQYIKALQAADRGQFQRLIDFVRA